MSRIGSPVERGINVHYVLLLFGLLIPIATLLFPGAAEANNPSRPYYVTVNNTDQNVPYSTVSAALSSAQSQVIASAGKVPTGCYLDIHYFDPSYSSPAKWLVELMYKTAPPANPTCPMVSSWIVGTRYPFDVGKNVGADDCDCDGGTQMQGDPINSATGNKYEKETDFSSDSPGLTFQRFYNSQGGVATTTLGTTWRHSFDRSLGFGYTSGGVAYNINLFRPNGRFQAFARPYQGAPWGTDADSANRLTEQDVNGIASSYTFYIANTKEYETYSPTGLLLSITDASGVVTTLTYSTASTPATVAPQPNLLLTVTDPKGRALNFTYDSSARLHMVTLPDGGVLTYAYDSSSNLATVTYPDTHTRQYFYNESSLTGGANLPGNLTGVMDEANVRYSNTTYDSQGRATSSSLAGGVDTTTITYGTATSGTPPSTLTTPLGATTNIGYQNILGALKVNGSSQPCAPQCNQSSQTRTYDSNGYPKSYTDFNGNVTATTFNSAGLQTQRIEAQGSAFQRTITTTWDTVLRNPLTRTTADASGMLVAQSAGIYNARGQVLASCDMDPTVTAAASYTCAVAGTPPVGVRRSTFTYCDAVDSTQCPLVGLLLSVNGPRTDVADVTQYRYYLTTDESGCGTTGGACHRTGDLYQITDALGHVSTVVAYDKNGRAVRQRNANGVITDLTYSPRGWLLTRSVRAHADGSPSAQDAVTTIAYDPAGTVHQVTDPDGVFVTYTYDLAHRLTDITDASGNRIHYTLDASGNRSAEQTFDTNNTARRSLTRKYNTLGQLISVADGLGQTVYNASFTDSYDANGNVVHTADALGVQSKLGYDGLNRLVSTLNNYNGTDAATKNTSSVLSYDALNRLNGITDPDSLSTTYDYDGLGNPKAIHSPDTGTASPFVSDTAGNRTQQTDAKGIVSTSVYDALNRVTSVSYADTTLNATYAYDEADSLTGCTGSASVGRLTRLIENAVTTVWCYDARGNVTQKRQTQSTQVDTTSYGYTLANRLSSVTSPSQTVTQYSRNTLGQISGVSVTPSGGAGQTVVSAISYLPFGPIASYTLGNGQTLTRSYDANYRLTDVTSPALTLHFALDAAGNIKALGNAPGANPALETYAYDPLYRLDTVNTPAGTAIEAYTYNKTGDRLSKTSSGLATGAYGYQTGTHWLNTIGSAARTYDANGNTTGSALGGDTFGFGYNGRNRMTVVQRNGVTVGSYVYNALGQRIAKTATMPQAISERFAYDEGSQLIGEYGTVNRDYIWMAGWPVAVVDTSGTTSIFNYVHVDGLGTPRVISNASGLTQWQWAYQGNPFGEQPPTSSTGYVFNLRFPGQYFDAESGLISNGFRDCYEPITGRYCQSDPRGLHGGMSTYQYVGGNSLRYVDPDGRTAAVAAPLVAAEAEGTALAASNPIGWIVAVGVSGYAVGTAINDTWGDSIGAGVEWVVGPPGGMSMSAVPRPQGMTKLEERHFDRTCKNSNDACAALKASAQAAIFGARVKMNNMLNDRSLFEHAFSSPNPTVTNSPTTWMNHAADLDGRLANIYAMISLGEKMGCDMSSEAAQAANLFVPSSPQSP